MILSRIIGSFLNPQICLKKENRKIILNLLLEKNVTLKNSCIIRLRATESFG
jgi:hypothetical protein